MASFVKFNANPYGKNTGDCVVRSLVGATLLGYRTISELLGEKLFPGVGVPHGVEFRKVEEFSSETGLIEPFDLEISEDMEITRKDLVQFGRYGGFPLKFWIDKLGGRTGSPRMVFQTKLNPEDMIPGSSSKNFHQVYANVSLGRYYDTWDCGNTIVFAAYGTDVSKVSKKDDPRYFSSERDVLRSEQEEYLGTRFRNREKT